MRKAALTLAYSLILLLISFLGRGQTIQDFKNELDTTTNDDRKAWLYGKISRLYQYNKPDSAIYFGRKAVSFSTAINNESELSVATNSLGGAFWIAGMLDSALYYYNIMEELSIKLDWDYGLSAAMINKGLIYQETGKYEKSLKVLFESIPIQENINDTSGVAISYTNIGNVYHYMDNPAKAYQYYLKAFRLSSSMANPPYRGTEAQNLGMVYYNRNQIDSAIYYLEFAKKEAEAYNSITDLASIHGNLATDYFKTKEYKKALESARLSLKYNQQIGNKYQIIASQKTLSQAFLLNGKTDSALLASREALDLSNSLELPEKLMESYKIYANALLAAGKPDEAFEAETKHQQYKDSVLNKKRDSALNEIETKFKVAQKDLEIAQKKQDIAEKQTQISLLGGGVILLIFLGGFLYFRIRSKEKEKIQLAIIEEKEKGFEAIVQATEEERKRISKDLHDGIGQRLSALKMGLKNFEKKLSDETLKPEMNSIIKNFSQSADEVRKVSHQMMPRVLMENGLIPAIDDMLSNAFQFSDIQYEFEYHNMKERLDERIEISLYRILQELINNVIKHSEANLVSVQLIRTGGRVVLIVEDNGKGLPAEQQSDGHGLMNIKNRLDMIKGRVNYEPSPESGTLATITVPVNK